MTINYWFSCFSALSGSRNGRMALHSIHGEIRSRRGTLLQELGTRKSMQIAVFSFCTMNPIVDTRVGTEKSEREAVPWGKDQTKTHWRCSNQPLAIIMATRTLHHGSASDSFSCPLSACSLPTAMSTWVIAICSPISQSDPRGNTTTDHYLVRFRYFEFPFTEW